MCIMPSASPIRPRQTALPSLGSVHPHFEGVNPIPTRALEENSSGPRIAHLAADAGALLPSLTDAVLARCEVVASYSMEPGRVTRTFLCDPIRRLHERLSGWMRDAGMTVHIDAGANLIGHYPAALADAPTLLIGSHLDTVPDAGKYDGVLGVLLGLAAVEALGGRRLPFGIGVVGFSEEEGVRYGVPYLGSRAVAGRFDPMLLGRVDARGVTMESAFRDFGLDAARIPEAALVGGRILGYLEPHIEQGPVLERLGAPVGVVEAIAGQSRLWLAFDGKAGHAGTLPMEHRRDALTAAAEFALEVERIARGRDGLRGTVGTFSIAPGAVNVVPGSARLSVDLRHARDEVREATLSEIQERAFAIAARRGVAFRIEGEEHHSAVPAHPDLTDLLAEAVQGAGQTPHRLISGAGHDASVMAGLTRMAMLFIRSPGGVSHHTDERVIPADVLVALGVIIRFLEILSDRS
jgi:allantoate deiminase